MEAKELKTVTLDQFKKMGPCWLDDPDRVAKLDEIGGRKANWTALDVLSLADIDPADRLWAVLHPEFLGDTIMHLFGCYCEEHALSKIDNPDPLIINAIAAKRAWVAGLETNTGLETARAAVDAAAWAARAAANAAAWAARAAANAAAWAARENEQNWQINALIDLIKEGQDGQTQNV